MAYLSEGLKWKEELEPIFEGLFSQNKKKFPVDDQELPSCDQVKLIEAKNHYLIYAASTDQNYESFRKIPKLEQSLNDFRKQIFARGLFVVCQEGRFFGIGPQRRHYVLLEVDRNKVPQQFILHDPKPSLFYSLASTKKMIKKIFPKATLKVNYTGVQPLARANQDCGLYVADMVQKIVHHQPVQQKSYLRMLWEKFIFIVKATFHVAEDTEIHESIKEAARRNDDKWIKDKILPKNHQEKLPHLVIEKDEEKPKLNSVKKSSQSLFCCFSAMFGKKSYQPISPQEKDDEFTLVDFLSSNSK